MVFRQALATSLAFVMALGMAPALMAQQGTITGRASDEADAPYTDYVVQLRDPNSTQVIATQSLNSQGEFTFTGLALSQYIVELVDTSDDNKIVCTEGPFGLDQTVQSISVNIDCGGAPLALWLAAGAAGVVASVGVLTNGDPDPHSGSN